MTHINTSDALITPPAAGFIGSFQLLFRALIHVITHFQRKTKHKSVYLFPAFFFPMTPPQSNDSNPTPQSEFYSFTGTNIKNEPIAFSQFKDKVCILVNTACNCKLAKKSFEQLRRVLKEFPDVHLLLFPSSFKRMGLVVNQELDDSQLIIDRLTAEELYNDRTTVFAKCTLNDSKGPIEWCGSKKTGIMGTTGVNWNFTKFVVSADGQVLARLGPNADYEALSAELKAVCNRK
ncbi:hypothetical protein NEHOM01_0891 [Nematocida homosporus]|uniref:uncharacterized protein n=1 Tax=Nematocida homosporus TaxID=1912981 RepID=UPI00221EFC37|nr:uncharacterized protein NEHOM01_0891 [Nematocida homosporus]KAI5185532.1 hypothetical protein NEHOM01_0891 [Nematocida homosporus]